MKKDKWTLHKLFSNNISRAVFSIVVAFVLWVVVVFTINTEMTRTIQNVPVNLTTNNSSFQNLGLDIVGRQDIRVEVRVRGDASVVGALTADSIFVAPNYTRVTQAGPYELTLNATKTNPLDNFTIVAVVPDVVALNFDTAMNKTLTIETEITGLQTVEGFIIENITTTPGTVKVTGPQNLIDQISRAIVQYDADEVLTATKLVNDLPVILLDRNGNQIPSKEVTIDHPTVDVSIPVYKRGTLPLKIEFTNVPEGFDLSSLKYTLSVTEIPIAASEETIDNITPRTIGYVDLSTFEIGAVYEFDLHLPSGMVNFGENSVTVTFNRDQISSKRINVTDIRVENIPANYKVSAVTQVISGVNIIGRAADVDALPQGSVVAVVDMSAGAIKVGQSTYVVKFIITANNTTWVAGSYNVILDVEAD